MIIYFRERGGEGDRDERNTDVREKHWSVAYCTFPDWDWTHNLSMYPDQGLDP